MLDSVGLENCKDSLVANNTCFSFLNNDNNNDNIDDDDDDDDDDNTYKPGGLNTTLL